MNNIINTSEIEVGDTFATYAKLVTALGLNICTGKQGGFYNVYNV